MKNMFSKIRKFKEVFMIVAIASTAGACVSTEVKNTVLPQRHDNQGWELVPGLSDEFNGSSLDENKWDRDRKSVV